MTTRQADDSNVNTPLPSPHETGTKMYLIIDCLPGTTGSLEMLNIITTLPNAHGPIQKKDILEYYLVVWHIMIMYSPAANGCRLGWVKNMLTGRIPKPLSPLATAGAHVTNGRKARKYNYKDRFSMIQFHYSVSHAYCTVSK